jgi:hypothetical protein
MILTLLLLLIYLMIGLAKYFVKKTMKMMTITVVVVRWRATKKVRGSTGMDRILVARARRMMIDMAITEEVAAAEEMTTTMVLEAMIAKADVATMRNEEVAATVVVTPVVAGRNQCVKTRIGSVRR